MKHLRDAALLPAYTAGSTAIYDSSNNKPNNDPCCACQVKTPAGHSRAIPT